MTSIRAKIRASKLFSRIYYGWKIDNFLFEKGLMGFKKNIDDALASHLSDQEKNDVSLVSSIRKDIINCYKLYKANPGEYFLYNFRNLPDEKRKTYATDAYENSVLCQVVGRDMHDKQLNDKYNFYRLTSQYFKRDVIAIFNKEDYNTFEKMALKVGNIIMKPNAESVGAGIIAADVKNAEDARKAFDKMMNHGGCWIVEERIKQDKEMARWNSSSVNTVRVSAFLTQKGFHVLSSILRTGRKGAVVDNAGRGGISAAIDPLTGVVASDGMDKNGGWYKTHPDSGADYKGYQIPRWKELLTLTEEIHKTIPNQIYVGWDFALTENGWVLIEGNWGQLGAQQVALGHGLKPMFEKYLKEGILKK